MTEKNTIQFAHVEDLEQSEAQLLGIDIKAQDSKYIEEKEFNEQVIQTARQPAEWKEPEKEKDPTEKRGRPKVEIDTDLLFKLAECHCSLKEMCYIMGVSKFTLTQRFQDSIDRGQAAGKMRLRKAQYRKALEGNPVMLIWLGKNVLGQKDDPTNGEEDLPLPWQD